MTMLSGAAAFAALAEMLRGADSVRTWSVEHPAFERLAAALAEDPPRASSLDLAVLLRQALRFEAARREWQSDPHVVVAHPRFNGFAGWHNVGLSARRGSDGLIVAARPWSPDWLDATDPRGVDARAGSEAVCRFGEASGVLGDPFLQAVARETYRSAGQRAAVRAALSAPPGSTLVIALPTGEGKSLVFQLVHAVGFAGASPPSDKAGVTLVIVPTVALGVNHETAALEATGLPAPLAYQGGNAEANQLIAERIADGTQGLCFASPEAACGPLRWALRNAAHTGLLKALVIDEAHLVDQWGTGFRSEFQELSGLRRELIAAALPATRPRTLLLSATLTDSSVETLRTLFGDSSTFECVTAVSLRPEPDYWVASQSSEAVREARVLEALHHLPRPLVLYVTQVSDADEWHQTLRRAGFGRVRKLHGKTERATREEIVKQWRDGRLDIVVGTSAFGLGIDYAHARCVVHACVPETLDRFYQEVGRGGRDGRASLSLILPTPSDLADAERINSEKVIGIDRGRHRWTAMFAGKRILEGGAYAVRIDGRPGVTEADIDMQGERNTDWNVRTLTLMARAGLIRLLGAPPRDGSTTGEWLALEIVDQDHLRLETWQTVVEPARRALAAANARNLMLMRRFLQDDACPASVLEDLYGLGRVGLTCSRCRICRIDQSAVRTPRPAGEPLAPWAPPPLSSDVEAILGSDNRLLVTYDPDDRGLAVSRRLGEALKRLHAGGFFKLLLLGEPPFNLQRVLAFAERAPLFVERIERLAFARLPAGAEVVLVAPDHRLDATSLVRRKSGQRVFVCPTSLREPGSDRRLIDVFDGRHFSLDEFCTRLAA